MSKFLRFAYPAFLGSVAAIFSIRSMAFGDSLASLAFGICSGVEFGIVLGVFWGSRRRVYCALCSAYVRVTERGDCVVCGDHLTGGW